MATTDLLLVGIALAAGCGFKAGSGPLPGDDAPDDAPTDGKHGDGGVDAPPDQMSGTECPPTYGAIIALGGTTSRYRFVGAPQLAWIDAENDCADDAVAGGRATHLIVLDSTAEKQGMMGGLVGGVLLNDQWAGVTDLQLEGTYRWVTPQTTTFPVTPTANNPTKDCVRVKDTGEEETRSCAETNRYVCECDGIAADPARFPNPPDGNP